MSATHLHHLAQLIGNDSHAATFQSLDQYRQALLKEITQASAAPEQEAVAWAICHHPGKVDELSATYANRRAAQAHVDGYRGDGSPELHITDLYTHPSAEIDRLQAEIKRLESAWHVDAMRRKDDLIAAQERENDRVKKELAEAQALLQRTHRDLDACQKVIWLAGVGSRGYGFDPAYCEDAQARLAEIDAFLSATAQQEKQP